MKKLIAIIFILFFVVCQANFATEKTPLNCPIKQLYSAPAENSSLVYSIPIEVKLLEISSDANWYKVKISFRFGPFASTYVGWAKIPVGQILAEREKEASEIANLSGTSK